MKYKIIGWLDLVIGSLGLLHQVVMLTIVYPKLNLLYQDFGVQLPAMTKIYPYITLMLVLILAAIVFIGVKLVFGKSPTKTQYIAGIIALIAMILGMGMMSYLAILSVVSPIYNLTDQF